MIRMQLVSNTHKWLVARNKGTIESIKRMTYLGGTVATGLVDF